MFDDMTEPHIIYRWLAARSVARGLPAPILEHDGWRVDVNTEKEQCRWVFSRISDGLRAVADKLSAPRHFIKLYGSGDALLAALPSHWHIESIGYVMTTDSATRQAKPLPPGYTQQSRNDGAVIVAEIFAPDGNLAASGYAAEAAGVFVYDRIVTEPAHGRRGLGSIIMNTLAQQRQSPAATEILVATDEGRALYTSLGWRVLSPFATAAIPG